MSAAFPKLKGYRRSPGGWLKRPSPFRVFRLWHDAEHGELALLFDPRLWVVLSWDTRDIPPPGGKVPSGSGFLVLDLYAGALAFVFRLRLYLRPRRLGYAPRRRR